MTRTGDLLRTATLVETRSIGVGLWDIKNSVGRAERGYGVNGANGHPELVVKVLGGMQAPTFLAVTVLVVIADL